MKSDGIREKVMMVWGDVDVVTVVRYGVMVTEAHRARTRAKFTI